MPPDPPPPPKAESPWKPPDPLKWGYDWKNIGLLASAVVGGPAGIIFGAAVGNLVGYVAGGLLIVGCIGWAYLRRESGALSRIREFLAGSQEPAGRELVPVVDSLRKWRNVGVVVVVVSILTAVTFGVIVVWPLVRHWYTTRPPGELKFPDARYYRPSQEEKLIEDVPFVQSLVTTLKDEGLGQGKRFRVVLGTSEPLAHPTPRAYYSMLLKEGQFSLSGFAFRQYVLQGRTLYEPLPLDFSRDQPAYFSLPPCEKGDRIFFVGLLTSEGPTEFPQNVPDLLLLKPAPAPEAK